ncbi:carbonic anhydrase [Halorubrum sp. DTA98]|uniref:carbonic anhydrase n=1 Tax=Halorubrum sp. DTA98 TaxID=3402163 RepID=UPI003AAC96C3
MVNRLLDTLIDRNDEHVASLSATAFDDCRDTQRPPVVSVCCSDSRVSQEGMWATDRPGFLFTAGNIGNRVRDDVDGTAVLDGSVAYPLRYADTDVLVVVGHTGCGAIGAALTAARTGELPNEPGVRADVEELVPVVEAGLDHPAVDADAPADEVHDPLVEYNVHEQVAFARDSDEASDADVYGFVYDFHGSYGDRDGAVYLVNVDGERDVDALHDVVDDEHADHVASLL